MSTYIVRMGLLPYYKVGSTKWDVHARIAALQTGNPFPPLSVRDEFDVGVVFYGMQELVRGNVHHVEPLRAVS